MSLIKDSKWKVCWRQETWSRPKGKDTVRRMICSDDYGVWCLTRKEAENFAAEIRKKGYDPKVIDLLRR